MQEWWIRFRRKEAQEDGVAIMPSTPKLLLWIAKNASRCSYVSIYLVEG